MGTIYIENDKNNSMGNSIFIQHCKSIGIIDEERIYGGADIDDCAVGKHYIPSLDGLVIFIGKCKDDHKGVRIKVSNDPSCNFNRRAKYDEVFIEEKEAPIKLKYKSNNGKRKHMTAAQEKELKEFIERHLDAFWDYNEVPSYTDQNLFNSIVRQDINNAKKK